MATRTAAAWGWVALGMAALAPAPAAAQADRLLHPCPAGNAAERQACDANAAAFRSDYAAAAAGDPEAQRRVALALSGMARPGPENPVRTDHQAACFWRVLVLRSARPGIGPADWDAQERDCRRGDVDFRAAEDDAARYLDRMNAGAASPPYAPPTVPQR